MVARFSGASLGLLAFTITTIAGLAVQNPVSVTLSRSILALFTFCLIGFVLGAAAQRVIGEHERQREKEIRDRCAEDVPKPSREGASAAIDEDEEEGVSAGT